MAEPTISDVLIAMTSMEGRLRTEIQESAKSVRNELRTEILDSAKGVQQELRVEIQESQAAAMEAIHDLASHMDQRFERVDNESVKLRAEMATKQDLHETEHRMKDYADRRAIATEEKLTCEIRRTDVKVERLIDVLQKKDVLTVKDTHHVVTGT